jgi:hypothetical protein
MDESRFKTLMGRARSLQSDYGAGYQRGLRRHYDGERFGTAEEHAKWSRLGLDGDRREELGRGYRDGCDGRDPEPLIGRPPLPDGEGKTARVEWRTTDERKAKAQRLAEAAGLSLSAWLDARVDKARE